MDWAQYQALAERPDVHTRYLLERTCAALEHGGVNCDERFKREVLSALRLALAQPPLPVPEGYLGGEVARLFEVRLGPDELRQLIAVLDGSPAPSAGDVARRGERPWRGFLEAWLEHYNALCPKGSGDAGKGGE